MEDSFEKELPPSEILRKSIVSKFPADIKPREGVEGVSGVDYQIANLIGPELSELRRIEKYRITNPSLA